MYRHYVAAFGIHSIGYDYGTEVLGIDYYQTGTYHYFPVPFSVYQHLLFVNDKPKYIASHLMKKYHTIKVR
ncbi:KTSC domain-containing protein [Providencia rettgeri]|uniref:KTSC domain-containing protein n=1 Tax=Providencia rettgeri TaxID=587 RepID=UPI0008FBC836|nr:KTSC domain-containing protein [Providencia rettgeri]